MGRTIQRKVGHRLKRLISATLTALAVAALMVAPVLGNHPGDRDCDDFDSHAEAQRFFERHGGSSTTNVDGLDGDSDGDACENYEYSGGGNEDTGNEDTGGEEDGDEMPDTAAIGAEQVSGLPLLLTVLGLGTFGLMLRRRIDVWS